MRFNKISHGFISTIFLLSLTLFLYSSIINGFWRWDDPQILLHAINNSVIDYFLNPQIWQELSGSNLTPWVTLSFDFDFFLFGLKPRYFYIHHLISLGLVSISCYFFLCLWINKNIALMGSILFLCGSPVATVVQQLMTRHYIEGLLFSIISLYFYIKFLRSEKNTFIFLSAILYIFSISAKEIYVPLVLLLPFIPENKFNFRLKATIPFFIILLSYIFWRDYMLVSLVDGYSDSNLFLTTNTIFSAINSFSAIPYLIIGKLYLASIFSYFLIILFYIKKTGSKLFLTLFLAFLVLAPLIPLVISPGISAPDRYLFLVWFLVSFSLAYYFGKIIESNVNNTQLISLVCLFLLFFYVSIERSTKIFKDTHSRGTEIDTQLRFIWEKNKNVSIAPTNDMLYSSWSINGMKTIKEMTHLGDGSPTVVFDAIHLKNTKNYLFTYDNLCSCMKNISNLIPIKLFEYEQKNKKEAPLSLLLTNNNGTVNWKFGPYTEGQYDVIFKDPNGYYPLSVVGKLITTLKNTIKFHVKYTSKSGWVTYSPELYLKANGSAINWNRHKKEKINQ